MKFSLGFILLILIVAGCAVKKAPETETPATASLENIPVLKPDYLWAFLPTVNVRKAAREDAEKLTQLSDGDSVTVLANRNGWYEITTAEQTRGWIRSDLLGPRNFSVFKRAVSFVDSLKEKKGIELYIDKNLYHKRIYIRFPAADYQSGEQVKKETKAILNAYQREVYRGAVSARVLQPDSEDEYMTIDSAGENNADPILPMIPFGLITQAHRRYAQEIALTYSVPDSISDQQLLKTARYLSASYPLSYTRIEIAFISKKPDTEKKCRLWFVEDARGEDYKFNDCP